MKSNLRVTDCIRRNMESDEFQRIIEFDLEINNCIRITNIRLIIQRFAEKQGKIIIEIPDNVSEEMQKFIFEFLLDVVKKYEEKVNNK